MPGRRFAAALLGLVLLTAACDGPAGEPVSEPSDPATVPTSDSSGPPGPYRPLFAPGATVAFFGDSQATIMLRPDRRPAWLAPYMTLVDESIEGCGIILGKIRSRSGEGRNLATDYRCEQWQAVWEDRVRATVPDVSVIMIGAWEVVDLTLPDGEPLGFGTPRWDENFNAALTQGIAVLRSVDRPVALALLPCYRPVTSSLGTGSGYWPERGDDERTRHINDLLRAAADSYPTGVFTLEPPPQLCTDPAISRCCQYRGDGLHTTPKGADLYFKAYVRQLIGVCSGDEDPLLARWRSLRCA